MLDRYLALTSPSPEAEPESIAARKGGDAYLRASRRCAAEASSNEHRCAMRAPTADAWEACID